jgi:hypothetical protein
MSLLWKLGGVAVALIAAYFLVTMYGSARYRQGKSDSDVAWSQNVIEAEKQKLIAYQDGVNSVHSAEVTYHETIRDRIIPVTKTIVERATEYAQTADGASVCLPVERVRLLDNARSALFPATTAPTTGRIGGTMQPDATGATTGRINDQSPGGTEPRPR